MGVGDCFMNCDEEVARIKKSAAEDAVRNEVCLEISRKADAENAFRQMCGGGSKGAIVNMAQIGGGAEGAAQHLRQAQRVPVRQQQLLKGLCPEDFFLHAGSGRVGLISTAIRTAMVGYTSRQMMHALNNIVRCQDGTVRSKSKGWRVVQFSYGDDDLDPERMACTRLSFLESEAKAANDAWAISLCVFCRRRYQTDWIETPCDLQSLKAQFGTRPKQSPHPDIARISDVEKKLFSIVFRSGEARGTPRKSIFQRAKSRALAAHHVGAIASQSVSHIWSSSSR